MGKRKLNGTHFYQCEWTGFPLRSPFCYMPTWGENKKLVKKGSYCNWESVVAHAAYQLQRGEMTAEDHTKVLEHVSMVTGTNVQPAPHYDELAHTKGRLDVHAFHSKCSVQDPVTAVKIASDGQIYEVLLVPEEGKIKFSDYLDRGTPFEHVNNRPSCFHTMRKKANKGTDRDLTVWYYPTKDLAHNQTASSLFKMQLYGDVLLVQQSREQCFMPRERYVCFTQADFTEQFNKKRKRTAEVVSLAPAQYEALKEKMQKDLNAFETAASSGAAKPHELSNVQALQPSSGRRLAQAVKERTTGPAPKPPLHLLTVP